MKRIVLYTVMLPLIVLATLGPMAAPTLQSPLSTPTAPTSPLPTPPLGGDTGAAQPGPDVSPVVWIGAGLILGAVIVLAAWRTAPHDR